MKNKNTILSPKTQIELIRIKEDKVIKEIMDYEKALKIKANPKKGWQYIIFEIGFSQFN